MVNAQTNNRTIEFKEIERINEHTIGWMRNWANEGPMNQRMGGSIFMQSNERELR